MNKILKKIALFMFALSMIMSMVTFTQSDVKAASLELNDKNTYTISGDTRTLDLNLSKSGTLSISVKTSSYRTYYYLYDSEGNKVWEETWNYRNDNLGVFMDTFELYLNAGNYYFSYNHDDSDLVSNTITITTNFKSAGESFKEYTYGNNNSMDTADTIKANTKYYGFITNTDRVDNYKFSLSKSETITLNLTSYIYNCDYYIYDFEGNCVWSDCYGYTNQNTGKYILSNEITLPKGSYIFSVSGDYYDGKYNFEIEKEVSKFYVKYYPNGGSGSMSRTTVEYGKNKALRDNTFKKTGYHFTGWTIYRESDKKWLYTNGNTNKWYKEGNQPSGYKKKVYKDEAVVSKLSSKNNDVVRAYAVWKRNTYTVKYLKNGGKGSMSNTTVTYGVSKSLRSNSFKRSGYKFVGWTCNRESDNKWYYSNGTKYGWYKEGKQPKGYKKVVYKNKAKIAKTTAKNKDTVYMVARWK